MEQKCVYFLLEVKGAITQLQTLTSKLGKEKVANKETGSFIPTLFFIFSLLIYKGKNSCVSC